MYLLNLYLYKKNDIDDLKHTISVVKARCLENLETQAACNEICADIYNEIARLEDEILKLSVEKNNVLSEYEKNIAWIAAFTQMGELKELNRTVLARLVDRIYVYDDKRIVIRFNYQDKYEELLKDIPGIRFFEEKEDCRRNYAYFPIVVGDAYGITRNELYDRFREKDIYARKYFYPLTSDQACFKNKYKK